MLTPLLFEKKKFDGIINLGFTDITFVTVFPCINLGFTDIPFVTVLPPRPETYKPRFY